MDKIKQLIAKLGQNKKLLWIIGGVAVVLVAAIILTVVLVGNNSSKPDDKETLKDCTFEVKTEGGMALNGVGIYIYTDSSKQELVSYVRTGENGEASVDIDVPKESVAVLDGVPAGYTVEEFYTVTESNTKIVLKAELLKEMSNITEGGVMFDFSVTTPDGTEYTLSELLKEKKAVVINLWYTGCQPCKIEFPYLQAAYEEYSKDIEILAIDPENVDDDAAVAAFKADNGLTFPMAKCSEEWTKVVPDIAYPTTIIVDRFGTAALIHTRYIDNSKTFKDAFAYFCADDYVQSVVESFSDLKSEESADSDGSIEKPYEFNSGDELEVNVEPGKTVYCNVYGVSGKVFECLNETVKVLYNETTFTSDEDGLITFYVESEDAEAPALIGFINEGEEEIKCLVEFKDAQGTEDSPLDIKLGDTIVELIAGNSKGLHYTYTASVNGVYSIKVKVDAEKADVDAILTNVTKDVTKTLENDGVKNESEGTVTVSVDVAPGDELKLVVTAKADEFGIYPATAAVITATAVEKTETQPPVSTVVPDNPSGDSGGSTGGSSGGNSGGSTVVTPPSKEDKLVNPDSPVEVATEIDKPMSFDAEVAAGTRVLYHLYKFGGTILTVSDPNVYVIYNGTKYTPQNGSIHVPVDSEGPTVPIEIEIGNSGSMNKTFRVSFYHPAGSYMNPLGLTLGKVTTNVAQGNEQGVYYTYTATTDGILTIELLSTTNGADANITLYNLASYEQVSINKESGDKSVSIEFYVGDEIQIIISTIPDENFNYPATTIQSNVTVAPLE